MGIKFESKQTLIRTYSILDGFIINDIEISYRIEIRGTYIVNIVYFERTGFNSIVIQVHDDELSNNAFDENRVYKLDIVMTDGKYETMYVNFIRTNTRNIISSVGQYNMDDTIYKELYTVQNSGEI